VLGVARFAKKVKLVEILASQEITNATNQKVVLVMGK